MYFYDSTTYNSIDMFRFDNLMENWAAHYKAILHNGENKRFFRLDDEFRLEEFLMAYQDIPTGQPVCGIVTHLEGSANIPKRIDYPVIDLLFLERGDPEDFRNQADTKADCNLHAWKFLAWLQHEKEKKSREDRTHPLAHLDLANVRFDMLGPITNAWFFCQVVTIQGIQYNPVCYSDTDYTNPI